MKSRGRSVAATLATTWEAPRRTAVPESLFFSVAPPQELCLYDANCLEEEKALTWKQTGTSCGAWDFFFLMDESASCANSAERSWIPPGASPQNVHVYNCLDCNTGLFVIITLYFQCLNHWFHWDKQQQLLSNVVNDKSRPFPFFTRTMFGGKQKHFQLFESDCKRKG